MHSSTDGDHQHNVFKRELQDKLMTINQSNKLHGERNEVIPPNDVVEFCTIDSIYIQEDIHK